MNLIIVFLILSLFIFLLVEWYINEFINPLILIKRSRIMNALADEISNLRAKKIITKKGVTPFKIIIISVILFFISTIILFSYIKVLSTSVILSAPFLISPIIASRLLIEKTKQKISEQIPFWAINIKNQMKDENNIIQAIKRTKIEDPLARYIDVFLKSVYNGTNVIVAFEKMKKDVAVKDFTELINSFELCYKNGGDFVEILEKYILMKTKERLKKEEAKEKIFSTIVTLIVMILLNIVVTVTYVFTDAEYATIMRTTFVGKIILNLNAITYILEAIIIANIYKEE